MKISKKEEKKKSNGKKKVTKPKVQEKDKGKDCDLVFIYWQ